MPVWVHKWWAWLLSESLVGGERKLSLFLGDGLVTG